MAILVLISWQSSCIFAISASLALTNLLKEVDAFICEFIFGSRKMTAYLLQTTKATTAAALVFIAGKQTSYHLRIFCILKAFANSK